MHSATGRMSVFCCWRQNRSVRAAGYAAVQAGYTHLGYIGQKNEENGTKYGTGYALGAEAAAADLDLEKTASRWIIRIGKAAAYHRRIWKKSKAGTVRADRFSSRTVHRIRMYLAQQHLRQACGRD